MNNTSEHPCRRKPTEIYPLNKNFVRIPRGRGCVWTEIFVCHGLDIVCLLLDELKPTGVYALSNIKHLLKTVFGWDTIPFENAMDLGLELAELFKFNENFARCKDIGSAGDNIRGEIAFGGSREDQGFEGIIGIFGTAVEHQVDTIK